jgi:starch synthase
MRPSACYITAEFAPYVKVGGLGDVSAALASILHGRGHDIRPFLPLYDDLDRKGLAIEPIAPLADLEIAMGPHRYRYSVLRGRQQHGGPDLYLVDCPALYGRKGIYGNAADEHLRFLALTRIALESCQRLGFAPRIVHCHDWHTALAPLYLRTIYAWDRLFEHTRTVLTIHNLGYQGVLPWDWVEGLGLGDAARELDAGERAEGRVNLLREGLKHADSVNTVSPGYAREICTPALGMGLDAVLRGRHDSVSGILNGVDHEAWDPATDPMLPAHFEAGDLSGKARMRTALADRLGLDAPAGTPLVGMVSRLNWQKGIDLTESVLPTLLGRGTIRLAVLGNGEARYEQFFDSLARDFPGRASFTRGYSEELSHWIEAGADAFLMPSRYEPCGLNQMYSLRYGTVPIVRRTGGLADSVEHFDPASGTGTGIVFNDPDPPAVRWALDTMIDWFRSPAAWRRLQLNGMQQDFSWERSADAYEALYRRTRRHGGKSKSG